MYQLSINTLTKADLQWAEEPTHHIISIDDEDYPPLLKEISDPPSLLYVKGDKKILKNPQIAFVGARNASPRGLLNAEQFAEALAAAGLTITSGLARGIDGASHKGALAAEGLTIGVAGTGLNHIYPQSHRKLYQQILDQGGAIISEFPLHTLPMAHHFPIRNRIISGLSLGVLVVEAALKSGSLISARHAVEQGREVFAIPGSIHEPLAKGCHYLIKQGAKLVETAADILEELVWTAKETTKKQIQKSEKLVDLSPNYLSLLENIGNEITSLDMLLLQSRLTATEVSSMLLKLELDGYIKFVPGGYLRAVPG